MISMENLPRTKEKHTLYIFPPHSQILLYLLDKNNISYKGEDDADLFFKPETIKEKEYWFKKYKEKMPDTNINMNQVNAITTNIDPNILFDFITNIPITGENVDPDIQQFIDVILTPRTYHENS